MQVNDVCIAFGMKSASSKNDHVLKFIKILNQSSSYECDKQNRPPCVYCCSVNHKDPEAERATGEQPDVWDLRLTQVTGSGRRSDFSGR